MLGLEGQCASFCELDGGRDLKMKIYGRLGERREATVEVYPAVAQTRQSRLTHFLYLARYTSSPETRVRQAQSLWRDHEI
jgi:hypothetical protein